jgi:hypothetical protein
MTIKVVNKEASLRIRILHQAVVAKVARVSQAMYQEHKVAARAEARKLTVEARAVSQDKVRRVVLLKEEKGILQTVVLLLAKTWTVMFPTRVLPAVEVLEVPVVLLPAKAEEARIVIVA